MKITVLNRQSLFDLAIQTAGSAEAAFEFAVLNGIAVSDDLQAGQELQVPAVWRKAIAEYYENKQLKPATGIAPAGGGGEGGDDGIRFGGIDYMGIEIDFIVS